MKTQKLLTIVRVMILIVATGILSLSSHAYTTNDEEANAFTGGGNDLSEETLEKLDLEPWMVSEDFWNVESGVSSMSSETIALEEWMMETPFDIASGSSAERIVLEPWMTSPLFFQVIEEKELNTIEDWMLEESFWTI